MAGHTVGNEGLRGEILILRSLGTGVHRYTIIDRSWPQRIYLPLENAGIPVRRLGAMNGECRMCNAVHIIRDFAVRTRVGSDTATSVRPPPEAYK